VPDPWIHRPDLQARPRTSTGTNQTPGTGPGPLGGGGGGSGPVANRVPESWEREYPGLNQAQAGVRSRHVSGPCRVRFGSPHRQRPDAATWPTARDVRQRVEPDVSPLGHAASTFNVDKERRLSTPLAGDVPPQH
jgi:hypothetical protein